MSGRLGHRVYYFCPEDGDDEAHPNVYALPANAEVDLGLIQRTFPLAEHQGETFVFRFKFPFKKRYVWLDLSSPDEPLPLYNGKLVMKVSRVVTGESTASVTEQPSSRVGNSPAVAGGTTSSKKASKASKTKKASASSSPPSAASSPPSSSSSVPSAQRASPEPEPINFFEESTSSTAASHSTSTTAAASAEADFFSPAPAVDFFASEQPSNATPATTGAPIASPSSNSNELLDLDFSSPSPAPAPTSASSATNNSNSKQSEVFGDLMFQM